MKAYEILDYLKSLSVSKIPTTCDTFKAGNPETVVNKVAVTIIGTPNVIRQAKEWGADLLITHEPTYHDHWDNIADNEVEIAKKKLVDESGLTIFRIHDHIHRASPDVIDAGFARALGIDINSILNGTYTTTPFAFAKLIEERLGLSHVRICGDANFETNKIGLFLGGCGDLLDEPIKSGKYELIIVGENCEWKYSEYCRDAGELGIKRTMLMLGHMGSERDGMKLLSDMIHENLGLETRYFEPGETYKFTD